MTKFAIAFLCLIAGIGSASAGDRPITRDMVMVALASAHINTRPGATWGLIDRTTGQAVEYTLKRFIVRTHGKSADIHIDAD